MEEKRTATAMVDLLEGFPGIKNELQAGDPIQILKNTAEQVEGIIPRYKTDKWVYRIAIGVLALLALAAAIGAIVLVSIDKAIPEVLVALGSAAVGGIVGLFAPPPSSKQTG